MLSINTAQIHSDSHRICSMLHFSLPIRCKQLESIVTNHFMLWTYALINKIQQQISDLFQPFAGISFRQTNEILRSFKNIQSIFFVRTFLPKLEFWWWTHLIFSAAFIRSTHEFLIDFNEQWTQSEREMEWNFNDITLFAIHINKENITRIVE